MKATFLIGFILLATLSNIYVSAEGLEFAYVGSKGPDFWHLLSEEAKVCETGKQQSPIDINAEDLKTLATPPNPMFNDANDVKSIHNGNTVEIFSGREGVPLPATIEIDGEKYELQQFHFHTPSEHRINGRHHDIEQHLVFKSKDDKVSVVAVFYDVGKKDSKFMGPIVDNLPKKTGDEKDIKKVELAGLLVDVKNVTEAFTYSGSLTTPPCTEGVTWFVNKNAQELSVLQYSELRGVIGFNSRFTQTRAKDQAELDELQNGNNPEVEEPTEVVPDKPTTPDDTTPTNPTTAPTIPTTSPTTAPTTPDDTTTTPDDTTTTPDDTTTTPDDTPDTTTTTTKKRSLYRRRSRFARRYFQQ